LAGRQPSAAAAAAAGAAAAAAAAALPLRPRRRSRPRKRRRRKRRKRTTVRPHTQLCRPAKQLACVGAVWLRAGTGRRADMGFSLFD